MLFTTTKCGLMPKVNITHLTHLDSILESINLMAHYISCGLKVEVNMDIVQYRIEVVLRSPLIDKQTMSLKFSFCHLNLLDNNIPHYYLGKERNCKL